MMVPDKINAIIIGFICPPARAFRASFSVMFFLFQPAGKDIRLRKIILKILKIRIAMTISPPVLCLT